MATTRRDFLRNTACALGGMALASSVESFGAVSALTPQSATGYKALVCVFLNGGNDGNNMVVSLDQYAAYSNARNAAGLAIPQANLLAVSPASGGSYGFNPSMPRCRRASPKGASPCSATTARSSSR
ncbi:MAG TPA: twin-arginine translocation signal domain-containing protein [Pyrinomonadaceae bacterium]|nr:twin-arginine translocation signal domain-containing protein [Pyrinomonadaceae bacterium]